MPATRKKKKFIDKKNAVKFHLVHRSQKDPLQADDTAPQRVLLPAASSDRAKQLEEQQKYGIYFDDDYDYMQHLKEVSEVSEWVPAQFLGSQNDEVMSEAAASTSSAAPRLLLPGSVFASHVERDVGVLNMAAPSSGPKLDWDPDVVAALDDDFDFDDPENALEDNFVVKANAAGEEGKKMGEDDGSDLDDDFVQQAGGTAGDGYMLAKYMQHNLQLQEQVADEGEEDSDVDSDDVEYSGEDDFSDEEEEEGGKKGTYSRYSISSSVLPRNCNLQLLDAWFDKVIEDYNDENIGALDHEELNGRVTMDSDLMKQALDDFEKSQKKLTMRDIVDSREKGERPVVAEEEGSDAESDTEYEWRVVQSNKPKWDCETIISTYSTMKNLPKTIYSEAEKRRMEKQKTPMPKEEEPQKSLTLKDIESEMSANARADRTCTFRPKGESAEERKVRKKAVKAEQMERRMEKKANKLAFREEHNRQLKQKANSSANQGVRLEYR